MTQTNRRALHAIFMTMASQIAFAGAALAQAAAAPTTADTPASEQVQPEVGSDEIIVTGTSIRGVAPTGSNLITVGRGSIQASGVTTTSELLATVPQLASFGTRPRTFGAGSPVTTFDIRGIGPDETLTLVNGRRQVGLGAVQTQPDPSALPPSAIERVEVLADGSSSIYGSDAVAGVVNIILRRDFNGIEANGIYGLADDYHEITGNLLVGKAWSTGSVMLGYQHRYNSSLLGGERSFVSNDLRRLGLTDNRSQFAYDPNVIVNGVSYATPGLQPNTVNRLDESQLRDLVPQQKSDSLMATFRQELTSNLELYGSANWTARHTTEHYPRQTASVTINNTNPYFITVPGTSATSETVNFSLGRILGPYTVNRLYVRTFGIDAGLKYDLGNTWEVDVAGNYGGGRYVYHGADINYAPINAAAAGTTTATALDPVGNGTSQAIIDSILDYESFIVTKQSFWQALASINGTVASLPGGDVKLSVGGELRHEKFAADQNISSSAGPADYLADASASRNVRSVYAELFIPLFSNSNAVPGIQSLNLSLSGRHDHYSDFGNTTNPKVGLSWNPIRDIKLRASYGKSFHAPSLARLDAIDNHIELIANDTRAGFTTPPGATTPLNVAVVFGGNPNLKPEKARTYSFGADITPAGVRGLRLSATYYNLRLNNTVGLPLFNGLYTNAGLAQYAIINPTAAQIASFSAYPVASSNISFPLSQTNVLIDSRAYNLGTRKQSGIDFESSYNLETQDAGTFNFGLNGTVLLTRKTAAVAGTPYANELRTGAIRWRARGELGWRSGPFQANAFVNYIGRYKNTNVSPVQTVKSYATVDTHLSYDIELFSRKLQLIVNTENLLDNKPPVYRAFEGFSGTSNPIGRFVELGVRALF